MSVETVVAQAEVPQLQIARLADGLIELVRSRHPEAQFHGPTYWPEERLWIIEAYFDHGEDFELQEQLSERETDLLLAESIWLCVIPMPMSLYAPL